MCLQGNITDSAQNRVDISYNFGILASTSIFACAFYAFMIGFCARNVVTIFYK